jgi:hypothetical protein
MIHLRLGIAVFAAVVLVAGFAPVASAQDIDGDYDLVGETSDAAPYAGSVTIVPLRQTFLMGWQRAAPLGNRGIALRMGDVLGVAVKDGDKDLGIVLYRVAGGHLEGIWHPIGISDGRLGRENLDGQAGQEGTFDISLGQNPDGSRYTGQVEIKRTGRTYMVDWSTPRPSYLGIGILMGDVFVVGYARQERPGVAAYCLGPAFTTGITASGNDAKVGTEILWRRGNGDPVAGEFRLKTLAAIR